MDTLVIDGELVPVDVVLRLHEPGHSERIAVGRQQVADRLGRAHGIVVPYGVRPAGQRSYHAQLGDQPAAVVGIVHRDVQDGKESGRHTDYRNHRSRGGGHGINIDGQGAGCGIEEGEGLVAGGLVGHKHDVHAVVGRPGRGGHHAEIVVVAFEADRGGWSC